MLRRRKLPELMVVYELTLADSADPFYVGITNNDAARLRAHKTTYGPEIEMHIVAHVQGRWNATLVERALIRERIEQGFKLTNKLNT